MLIAAWYVWRSWPVAADVPARPRASRSDRLHRPRRRTTLRHRRFQRRRRGGIADTTTLVVHVAGSVAQPGIVTLPSGARVADAIQAAGGALPGTDTTGVNLARVLVDGEQVLVGVPAAVGAPVAGPGAPVPTQGAAGGPLDLNAATLDQLQDLPGLGPVLAQRIVDWRTAHGRFTNVDELKQLLLSDPDQLARALAVHLATYATGAAPTPGDRAEIEAVVEKVRSRGHGLRTLVHEIVQSPLFRNK